MTQDKPEAPKPGTDPSPTAPVVRRRRVWPWIIFGCLVVICGWLVFGHRRASPTQQARAKGPGGATPAVQVATAEARKGDVRVFVDGLGVVTPVNTVMVKSRVDGQLMSGFSSRRLTLSRVYL